MCVCATGTNRVTITGNRALASGCYCMSLIFIRHTYDDSCTCTSLYDSSWFHSSIILFCVNLQGSTNVVEEVRKLEMMLEKERSLRETLEGEVKLCSRKLEKERDDHIAEIESVRKSRSTLEADWNAKFLDQEKLVRAAHDASRLLEEDLRNLRTQVCWISLCSFPFDFSCSIFLSLAFRYYLSDLYMID